MKYILDVKRWRCGKEGYFRHGEGNTAMLNPEGYMCCLGHFAKQFGVPDDKLLSTINPHHLASVLEGKKYDPAMLSSSEANLNSDLACDLIRINDNPMTSMAEKIVSIREKLEAAGHELEVINLTPDATE